MTGRQRIAARRKRAAEPRTGGTYSVSVSEAIQVVPHTRLSAAKASQDACRTKKGVALVPQPLLVSLTTRLLWPTASAAATAAAWSATPAAMPPPALTSGTTARTTRSARFHGCSVGRAVGTIEVGFIATLDEGLIIIEL